MDRNERDTHFQGFADLLASEIDEVLHLLDNPYFVSSGMRNEVVTLIAQRAYDLVEYILNQTPTGTRYIHSFKDMDEWPEHRRFADALADLAKIKPPAEWPKPQ